jgi:hypothetical protein
MRPCAGQYSRDQAIAQAGIPKYANAAKEAGPATASLDVEAGERMTVASKRRCARSRASRPRPLASSAESLGLYW